MSVQFKYQAVSQDGHRHSGLISADRQSQVEDLLTGPDLLPVSITPKKTASRFSLTNLLNGSGSEELIMFTNSLSTLHKA